MTNQPSIKKHYLYPSVVFVNKERHIVDTVLGSCVSVCLYSQMHQFGGINHFMLPLWNGQGLATPKYGNIAIEKLVAKMFAAGCEKKDLIAKVFGGSEQLSNKSKVIFNTGQKNIELTKKMLHEYNIKIVAANLGGDRGRKIRFDTFTGEVMLKFLQGISYPDNVKSHEK